MRKLLILSLLLFVLPGCTDNTGAGVTGDKARESKQNVKIEPVKKEEGRQFVNLEEVERIKMLKNDNPELSFLKACDNLIVAKYDLNECVFVVQNEQETEADCVILCEQVK
jgi:hypothetical protein